MAHRQVDLPNPTTQRGFILDSDAYLFSDAADGTVPWKPDSVSQFFGRLRDRAGLAHLSFHQLRKFMETYGQEMGYSVTQVALRAGHNPSVAARHYSGKVAETDRELARAIASLLVRGKSEPTAGRGSSVLQ
jgi:integrase